MHIELINTGSELMLGRVLNTHQQWLCRQLADAGYVVERQVAVPDTGPAIEQSVREALGRADLIIATGGLGPTSDDITRDLIAQLLGCRLHTDPAVLSQIARFFTSRQRPQPESTKVQAQVPAGARVLMNRRGTAPGLVMEVPAGKFRQATRPTLLVMLPGPPRELRPMFTEQVMPVIRECLPLIEPFACRTVRTAGIGESRVEEMVAPPLASLVQAGLEIGYCARPGEVDVRLVAHGARAGQLVNEGIAIIQPLLGQHVYGEEDAGLEQVIVQLFAERKQTLVIAESCTGGLISHRLTNVPGASEILWGGLTTYANAAKQKILGVTPAALAQYGAVSEAVARAMAEGARRLSGASYAVAVTGIAGPGGGTPEKPVGTVFMAVAGPQGTVVKAQLNRFDRETFKYVTSQQVLEMLRRQVIAEDELRKAE